MVEAQTPWVGDGLCTSGDHERELLASFYHCWCPGGGGVFLSSHNKIHDTQTSFVCHRVSKSVLRHCMLHSTS